MNAAATEPASSSTSSPAPLTAAQAAARRKAWVRTLARLGVHTHDPFKAPKHVRKPGHRLATPEGNRRKNPPPNPLERKR
jgi:hypothetical protein